MLVFNFLQFRLSRTFEPVQKDKLTARFAVSDSLTFRITVCLIFRKTGDVTVSHNIIPQSHAAESCGSVLRAH